MEYKGGSCITQWVWSGGTLNMSGDTRSLSIESSLAVLDATEAQHSQRGYLAGQTEWTINWSGVAQNNASNPAGTLYAQALAMGQPGKLLISPFGTALGMAFYSGDGFSAGVTMTEPYADVVSVSASWYITSATSGSGIIIGVYGMFIVGIGIVGTSYIGA
jgi:hypothetical protein